MAFHITKLKLIPKKKKKEIGSLFHWTLRQNKNFYVKGKTIELSEKKKNIFLTYGRVYWTQETLTLKEKD